MTIKSKIEVLTILGLLVCVRPLKAAEAQAQPDKRTIVAMTMELTPEQFEKFWPLYDEYQIEINKLNSDRMAVLNKYAINYNNVTDDLAKHLMNETLKIERKRVDLKKKLITKFSKDFPAKVVARYFQIENKLDVMIMAAAAEKIPFVK